MLTATVEARPRIPTVEVLVFKYCLPGVEFCYEVRVVQVGFSRGYYHPQFSSPGLPSTLGGPRRSATAR